MRPPPICMLNPIIVVGTFLASVKLTEWSGQYLVLTYFFNSSKAVLDLVQSSTELNWTLHSPGFASADKFDKHPLHVSTQHSQLHLPSAPNSRRITASRYNIFVVTRLNVSMSQCLNDWSASITSRLTIVSMSYDHAVTYDENNKLVGTFNLRILCCARWHHSESYTKYQNSTSLTIMSPLW